VPLAAAGGIGAWAFPTQLKYFQKVMRWGIKCPACQHYVGHDAEWKCGHCGHENLKDSGKLGLFAGCWECRCRPKSVECPGCRQILYLDLDADARNPARLMESLPVEVPAPVEPTAEETEKVEHTMQVEKLQRERELLRARMLTDTVRHQAGKVASRLQEEDTSTILERNVKKWTESIHDQIMAAAQLTIQAEQFKKELSNQPGFSALPEKAQRNLLFSVDEAVGKTIRQQSQKPKT
jgi:phage terminase large subunit GpA-like protein